MKLIIILKEINIYKTKLTFKINFVHFEFKYLIIWQNTFNTILLHSLHAFLQ